MKQDRKETATDCATKFGEDLTKGPLFTGRRNLYCNKNAQAILWETFNVDI